jgi:hypothetical protein
MLDELNGRFALQLDLSPITGWSCKSPTDNQPESDITVLLAGSSHSTRLIHPLETARLTVIDCTVPGFCITESSVASMAADIEEGDRPGPILDGKYHLEGKLVVVNKDTL